MPGYWTVTSPITTLLCICPPVCFRFYATYISVSSFVGAERERITTHPTRKVDLGPDLQPGGSRPGGYNLLAMNLEPHHCYPCLKKSDMTCDALLMYVAEESLGAFVDHCLSFEGTHTITQYCLHLYTHISGGIRKVTSLFPLHIYHVHISFSFHLLISNACH